MQLRHNVTGVIAVIQALATEFSKAKFAQQIAIHLARLIVARWQLNTSTFHSATSSMASFEDVLTVRVRNDDVQ